MMNTPLDVLSSPSSVHSVTCPSAVSASSACVCLTLVLVLLLDGDMDGVMVEEEEEELVGGPRVLSAATGTCSDDEPSSDGDGDADKARVAESSEGVLVMLDAAG